LKNELATKLDVFMDEHGLGQDYQQNIIAYIQPLAEKLMTIKQNKQTLVVGINGAQGSGKSTLAACLALLLQDKGYAVATLSLDDLYLNQAKRKQLAHDIHPLLQTRGVPGTHDVALGMAVLEQLKHGQGIVRLPRFDKAKDNPKPQESWDIIASPVDIVLFEGWCVGAVAQSDKDLQTPINSLEAEQDKQGVWRNYVNDKLGHEYATWFSCIDTLVYLQVPSFDQVFAWRKKQERQTFQGKGMSDAELRRFIQHYERITRWNIKTMPDLADMVLQLDTEQHIYALKSKS
jgi:D-glycerate 3-kinase